MITKKKAWILASRPKTLPASIGPVVLGSSLTSPDILLQNKLIFLLTLICAILLQVSTNLVNDYYDSVRGLDDSNRLGPDRALQKGWLRKDELKKGFIITFLLSFLIGIYLMVHGDLPIIIIGILSILMAYMYTGGPLPLSYFGLGEILALVFFGPIPVWGTYFLIERSWDIEPALVGLIPGFISLSLMGINNLRDHVNDKAKGKKTLSTLFGPKFGRHLVLAGITISVLIPIYLGISSGVYFFFSPLIPAFLMKNTWIAILKGPIDASLNIRLATTGKFLFINCMLTATSYWVLWTF